MDGPQLPVRAESPREMEALQKEKEALRIQAAAVVAQQAALTEEETKLRQRETALQRQEEQLAAHLESKRSQLIALQEQLGEARASLRRERYAFDQEVKTRREEVEHQGSEACAAKEMARRERQRFIVLRRRLKRRWRKHWAVQEAEMRRREQALEAEWRRLADEADRVRQDRNAQVKTQLRFNGDMELGRRQLQQDRTELALQQQAWEKRKAAEQHELQKQSQALNERETLLTHIERDLLLDKEQWETARLHLQAEIEGLQSRARSLRQKLIEQQEEAVRSGATPRELPAALSESTSFSVPEIAGVVGAQPDEAVVQQLNLLERLSGDLADQRVHLAEQFSRLVQSEQSWRQAHGETIVQWEVLARHLQERERAIVARERSQQHAEDDLRRRREETANTRCQLDAWRARLSMREAAWATERASLLARVQAGEELTKRQLAALDDLREKWKQRRRDQTSESQKAIAQFVEARRLYAGLWEDCLRRGTAMEQEKRKLAEQTLALEQFRLEVIGQAESAATAERQLERLRRRWVALFAEAERSLAREREMLQAEIARVEERSRQIEEQAAYVVARQADQATRQTEWEEHQQLVDDANVRLRKELELLRVERAQQERQLTALRDEVERMAHTLLEGGEPLHHTTSRAA